MSWATRRRTAILIIVGAVVLAAAAVILIAALYEAPTCTDQKMDGDETGIDCGGTCALLCSADALAPKVTFTRALSPAPGRTDVIAYIDNQNPSSGVEDARFTVSLYGPDGILVASEQGTVDLPPHASVPVYVPDFFSGNQPVARAFLVLDPASLQWMKYSSDRVKLATSYELADEETAPRITAAITNPSAVPLYDVKVIATAFGADGNAIAASQTIVPQVPAAGSAVATFTWNAPFGAAVTRVDILPVLPLAP